MCAIISGITENARYEICLLTVAHKCAMKQSDDKLEIVESLCLSMNDAYAESHIIFSAKQEVRIFKVTDYDGYHSLSASTTVNTERHSTM